MLKRVYVDNFGCLVNFEFRPSQVNLLLGRNGSGKTTLLDVLRRLRDVVVFGHRVPDVFPLFTKTQWETRPRQRFEIEIEDADETYAYVLVIEQDPKTGPRIQEEILSVGGKPLFRLGEGKIHLFGDDHAPGPSFAFQAPYSPLASHASAGSKMRVFLDFLEKIWIFRLNPWLLMDASSTSEQAALTESGSNFPSWYRGLVQAQPEISSSIRDSLKQVLPGFEGFRLPDWGQAGTRLLVAVFSRPAGGPTYVLTLANLSEGQRCLVILYSILHAIAGRATMLVIDEPDNFVALQEIQPWLNLLRQAIEDQNTQLVVISHNPDVIDYLAADSAYLFTRPSGDVTVCREFPVDRSQGITASEYLRLTS
jgi:energy-coupling factor transporter ATP-binding protein EcfA2